MPSDCGAAGALQDGQGDGDAAGDQVHVALPAGRQAASALHAGALLHQADGLEVLQDVPDQAACGQRAREGGKVGQNSGEPHAMLVCAPRTV